MANQTKNEVVAEAITNIGKILNVPFFSKGVNELLHAILCSVYSSGSVDGYDKAVQNQIDKLNQSIAKNEHY